MPGLTENIIKMKMLAICQSSKFNLMEFKENTQVTDLTEWLMLESGFQLNQLHSLESSPCTHTYYIVHFQESNISSPTHDE